MIQLNTFSNTDGSIMCLICASMSPFMSLTQVYWCNFCSYFLFLFVLRAVHRIDFWDLLVARSILNAWMKKLLSNLKAIFILRWGCVNVPYLVSTDSRTVICAHLRLCVKCGAMVSKGKMGLFMVIWDLLSWLVSIKISLLILWSVRE
jgi:hypothetical protein